jgi:hypothetical protein
MSDDDSPSILNTPIFMNLSLTTYKIENLLVRGIDALKLVVGMCKDR